MSSPADQSPEETHVKRQLHFSNAKEISSPLINIQGALSDGSFLSPNRDEAAKE